MTSAVQTSLFDLPEPDDGLGPLGGLVTRQVLGRGAWVDLLPGWLSGADALFDTLLTAVPWVAERRQMYERVVDVPVERVWAAWTEPELLMQWFTPRPWTTSECEIDLRAGGKFRTVMRGPQGERHDTSGCYLEVIPNRRLVFTAG